SVARGTQGAAFEAWLRRRAPNPERAHRAARDWRSRRPIPPSTDGPDLSRHRIGDRLRRAGHGRGSRRPEVPELARDADLFEEPHAVRTAPDEGGDSKAWVRSARRGLLRFRPGVSNRRGTR